MQIFRNMNRPEKGFENWEEISEHDITLSLATYTHIGIVAAMLPEVRQIVNQLNHYREYKVDGFHFYAGSITSKIDNEYKKIVPIVIGISGPGKVNAALCTDKLIELFDVDCIINVGIVGAISKDLDVYDMVVSDKVVQADIDTTAVGDDAGLVSRLNKVYFEGNSTLVDIIYDTCVNLPMTENIEHIIQAELQADKEYFEKIYKDLGEPVQDGMITESLCKSYTEVELNYKCPNNFVKGLVSTTDSFIATDEQKNKILKNFPQTQVCDMELGAIAQTCYIKNRPFVSIKLISDNADNTAIETYPEVLKTASSVFLVLIERCLYKVYEVKDEIRFSIKKEKERSVENGEFSFDR